MEHAQELFPYLISLLGVMGLYILNGIKGEISDVKVSLSSIEKDLRGGLTELERRVSHLEGVVETHHTQHTLGQQ